ncbi:MAG: hypothetical protein ACRD0W_02190 [Acidimicrobiales bacterium]
MIRTVTVRILAGVGALVLGWSALAGAWYWARVKIDARSAA